MPLRFEAITDRARGAASIQQTQRRLVERYLAHASSSTSLDLELGYTLFELLLPQAFKEGAPDRRKLAVLLDESAARFPWELLHDRNDPGSRPVAVETGMIRQLMTSGDDARAIHTRENKALVIGNPGAASSVFPDLPGAEAEATEVVELLRKDGFTITQLIGSDASPDRVVPELLRAWRILHIAAHGVVDYQAPGSTDKVTGVVLDGDVFITPAEINCIRSMPELVFINCCHLGQTLRTPFHELAANIGTQFIKNGARAVVAAGWAVDDGAARTFATRFYKDMLDGMEFGDAVLRARQEVYEGHGATNTWGAYQCYGDPGFRLRRLSNTASPVAPVAPNEAAYRVASIARQAHSATKAERTRLAGELERLVSMFPAPWLRMSAVCGALGTAYGEVGDFPKAIDFYTRALMDERANVSLQAVEQMANLMARSAPVESTRDVLERVRQLLGSLLAFAETAERHSLMGSLHKWRAKVLAGADRRQALEDARAEYSRAYAIKVANQDTDTWYPLANAVAVEIVLGWSSHAAGPPEGLAELTRQAASMANRANTIWELGLAGDHGLLVGLAAGAFAPQAISDIKDAYRVALRGGASHREVESMRAHIEFFERMVETEARSHERDPLLVTLADIKASLDD